MLNRRLLKNLDWLLIAAALGIVGFGLLAIASATRSWSPDPYYFVKRQVIWLAFGLVAMVVVLLFDYNTFASLSRLLYAGNLGLLAVVMVVGKVALGAQRRISLGFFELQPSELAKVVIILTLAALLRRREGQLSSWQDLTWPLVHVGIPMLLILKQPDLGTSLVFIAILLGQLYMAGAPVKKLGIVFGGAFGAVVAWIILHLKFGVPIPLAEYQLNRLLVFLNPQADPLGAGYHVIQSTIAVGSGGLLGKGLFAGTQNRLNFLPEQHTDFIFSVIAEEMGFVGVVALMALFFVLIWRGVRIMAQAKDLYGVLVAAGITTMFAFHVLVNVGMTAGIMPVTGIPLPMVSYGGSSMLSSFTAIGLLLNVQMRHHKILF